MPVAMITAGIAAAGAVLGVMRENSAATKEMEDFGRHVAATEIKAAQRQEGLVGQTAAVMETAQRQSVMIEQNQLSASADASVAAAVSGTAGQSVDLSYSEIEANAGRAQGANDKLLQNRIRGIDQTSRDINFDKDSEMFDYEPIDTKGQLAGVFLAGLQGFVSAEGFGT